MTLHWKNSLMDKCPYPLLFKVYRFAWETAIMNNAMTSKRSGKSG